MQKNIAIKITLLEYLLLGLAFLIPTVQWLLPYAVELVFLLWLLEGGYVAKFKTLYSNKGALLFLGLYALYAMGMLYTQNTVNGLFDLVLKLSMVVFPLIMLSGTAMIDRVKLNRVLLSFVIGCLAICLFLAIRAFHAYSLTKDLTKFTYVDLSYIMHPGYLAMYLTFALIIVFLTIFEKTTSWMYLAVRIIVMLFFALFIMLLSSKAGILSLLFAAVFMLVFLIYKKKYLMVILAIIVAIVMVFMVLKYSKFTIVRIKAAYNVLVNYKGISTQTDDSTSDRIVIWRVSEKVIKANPLFGVGTGDVKDALMQVYKTDSVDFAVKKSLNAHNQYIQTTVAIGLIGGSVLLMSLLLPLYWALKRRNWIYVFFLMLILLNFLFESMLERQAGVIFYAFFNALLYNRMFANKNKV